MIETSLIKLNEAVNEGQKLSAGTKVVLPTGDEAEIYGFIAIEDNILSMNIDMPPLGECNVFSNRVIFYFDKQLHRFPIFRSVCKPSEEKYELYLLYVIKLLYSYSGWPLKAYFQYMGRKHILSDLKKLDGVKIEENVAYYYPNEHELYFESSSILRAMGNGFAVVTRRFSKLLDSIKYEIYDSHSVKTERK